MTAGFVTRSGRSLVLDGQPYRFTGINIYPANNKGGCGDVMATGSVLSDSLTAISPNGPQVIRAWFFQALATTAGLRDWSAMDNTLAVCAAHGTKIIATLGQQWDACDGAGAGPGHNKDETWYTTGYTQPDPAGTVSYRDWAVEIVSRYKDDPTILAWQLMNEAEVRNVAFNGCATNALGILKAFAADVSGRIKTVDANHLVSLGTMGNGQCSAQFLEYETLHDIPTIDLCEYHDYTAPTTAFPGDIWNGLNKRIEQAAALDKPLFVGETGILLGEASSLQQRADFFAAKFAAQFDAGIVGELVWAWDKDGSVANYDIGPGDPTLAVIEQFAQRPKLPLSLVRETATRYVLGWDPVVGAAGYRFTRSGLPSGKWAHTWDGALSEAPFPKGDDWYSVQPLMPGDRWEWRP